MTLHHEFLKLSKEARPRILKLARKRRLVDQCFKEFQRMVYPDAPPDQVAALRVAFFAGVTELNAMMIYAADTDTHDPTDQDLDLFSNIIEEVETFHQRTIDASRADETKRN